jgi:hypothetical protein
MSEKIFFQNDIKNIIFQIDISKIMLFQKYIKIYGKISAFYLHIRSAFYPHVRISDLYIRSDTSTNQSNS